MRWLFNPPRVAFVVPSAAKGKLEAVAHSRCLVRSPPVPSVLLPQGPDRLTEKSKRKTCRCFCCCGVALSSICATWRVSCDACQRVSGSRVTSPDDLGHV